MACKSDNLKIFDDPESSRPLYYCADRRALCRSDCPDWISNKQTDDLPTRLRALAEEMRECADALQDNGNEVETTMLRRWSSYVENYAIGINAATELEKDVNNSAAT